MCFVCTLRMAQAGDEECSAALKKSRENFSDMMDKCQEDALLTLGVMLGKIEGRHGSGPQIENVKPGDILISLFSSDTPDGGGPILNNKASAVGLGFYIARYLDAYMQWLDTGLGSPSYEVLRENINKDPKEHARFALRRKMEDAEDSFKAQFGEQKFERVKDHVREIIEEIIGNDNAE